MNWRLWLKRERIIPSATILLAFIAGALGLFKVTELSIGETIILALIALLAGDALTERLTVLERISSDIRNISRYRTHFQTRSQLPPLKEQLENVQSIDIVGLSLFTIATQHYDLLMKKVKEDKCKIRLVCLNPDNEKLMKMTYIFSPLPNPEDYKKTITTAWNILTKDKDFLKSESEHVQLYTYDYPLAYSLFIVNGDKHDGKMRIEMYLQNMAPANTPGFPILREEDPALFNTFLAEFNEILKKATLYKPA